MLSCDDHPVAPRDGLAVLHPLDEGFVTKEIIKDLLLPMDGHSGWGVAGLWRCVGVNMHFYCWPLHTRQCMVRACVERGGGVSVQ